jgi:hypothetical protein
MFELLMAGRSRKDTSPRNSYTVQVCVDGETHFQLQQLANAKFDGKLSIAARSMLSKSLAVASR